MMRNTYDHNMRLINADVGSFILYHEEKRDGSKAQMQM